MEDEKLQATQKHFEHDHEFKRSPTIFVKNVDAERRKNILRVRYHSQNACEVHHKLDYLRVIMTLIGSIILLGSASSGFEVRDDGFVFKAPASYWACAGFVCMSIGAIYEVLRYIHYKQRAVTISGILYVTCLLLLCIYFGLKDSTQRRRRRQRSSGGQGIDIMGLVAAIFTLGHSITFNIAYTTFAGLYAPIVPSTHAPTILPISALYTIGSAGLVTAFAMALVGNTEEAERLRVNGFIRAQKGCLIGAFVFWTLAAWGELGVVFVSSQNLKRRQAHRDQLEAEQIERNKLLMIKTTNVTNTTLLDDDDDHDGYDDDNKP